jgi:hypothetical protein
MAVAAAAEYQQATTKPSDYHDARTKKGWTERVDL